METLSEDIDPAEQALERYKGELSRLQAQQKGLETKMNSLRAKIEAAQEIIENSKALALLKMKKPN